VKSHWAVLLLLLKMIIKKEGAPRGLFLNVTKCEAKTTAGLTDAAPQQLVQLTPPSSVLLGAPLFKGAAMDDCLTKRCADLERTVSRFEAISSHDALVLLSSSFSAPKY
jgi:hypothetical protein